MSMNLHVACHEEDGTVFDMFPLQQTPTSVTEEILGGAGIWNVEGVDPCMGKYLLWVRSNCNSHSEYEDFRDYEELLYKWFKSRAKYVTNCKFIWYKA